MSVQETKQTPDEGPTNSPSPLPESNDPTPETKLPEGILKIQLNCQHCGIAWQFENIDSVAQTSIDHHYKSGECYKRQAEIISRRQFERSWTNMWNHIAQQDYWQSTSGTAANKIWHNPPRGRWTYL